MEYTLVKQEIIKQLRDNINHLQTIYNTSNAIMVSIISELLSELRVAELYELNILWENKYNQLQNKIDENSGSKSENNITPFSPDKEN